MIAGVLCARGAPGGSPAAGRKALAGRPAPQGRLLKHHAERRCILLALVPYGSVIPALAASRGGDSEGLRGVELKLNDCRRSLRPAGRRAEARRQAGRPAPQRPLTRLKRQQVGFATESRLKRRGLTRACDRLGCATGHRSR